MRVSLQDFPICQTEILFKKNIWKTTNDFYLPYKLETCTHISSLVI